MGLSTSRYQHSGANIRTTDGLTSWSYGTLRIGGEQGPEYDLDQVIAAQMAKQPWRFATLTTPDMAELAVMRVATNEFRVGSFALRYPADFSPAHLSQPQRACSRCSAVDVSFRMTSDAATHQGRYAYTCRKCRHEWSEPLQFVVKRMFSPGPLRLPIVESRPLETRTVTSVADTGANASVQVINQDVPLATAAKSHPLPAVATPAPVIASSAPVPVAALQSEADVQSLPSESSLELGALAGLSVKGIGHIRDSDDQPIIYDEAAGTIAFRFRGGPGKVMITTPLYSLEKVLASKKLRYGYGALGLPCKSYRRYADPFKVHIDGADLSYPGDFRDASLLVTPEADATRAHEALASWTNPTAATSV